MRRFSFLVFRALCTLCAVLVPCLVLVLMGYLFRRGLPELGLDLLFGRADPLDAVLGRVPVWDGLWPACVGTFWLVVLTVLLAVFPGVGCGIYLSELASPRQKRILGAAVDMLAGMPSIVMGLFGFMLILLLRRTVLPDANTGLLLAAGCLALLVLPVLTASAREAMAAVPDSLRLAAAACGFSRAQALFHLFLPAAARGILGGVVLAVGRAAEDTAVILFTGVVANAGLPSGLLGKFEALSFDIYYISSQYQDQQELLRGFGAATLLLVISCLLLAAARVLERGFRKKWQTKA
ncbi:PstA family ABC transporter permease [uncultured Mailhella sp.]|uniref:PstA family ABC transporter permease n=1 Tax=uncultured Mailhella sp. TaxID=1981031 RepID=UPI0025D6CD1D|nr:ABC transporter permease subunit [uncultured Mailhella sp.]